MFTGIIESLGTIRQARPGNGLVLAIESGFDLDEVKIGDSIAVSGACLTVVTMQGRVFTVDVSPETCERTTVGQLRPGDRVNLERALRMGSRLDGHLVSGHIDGVGHIRFIKKQENAVFIDIEAPDSVARYIVEKGSVAVDGISLTVNACDDNGFSLAIIPHTAAITTIGLKGPGDPVNLEADIIGKYVEKFVRASQGRSDKNEKSDGVSMDLLAKAGFM